MESSRRSARLEEELRTHISHDQLNYAISTARTYLGLREEVKFHYLRAYNLLRQTVQRLEWHFGWTRSAIFHLKVEEVVTLGGEIPPLGHYLSNEEKLSLDRCRSTMISVAHARREEWERNRRLFVPPVFRTDEVGSIGHPPQLNDGTVLYGIGVTDDVTEGEVVVVERPDAEVVARLRPGSVLVTVTTDPAWSPLLAIVGRQGGLVTEVGGLLAHGAIYAREMGIAAVLNVPGATRILKNGMRVRVNGTRGYVEILRR
jgi:phosphohistidine swiveling domain-containing protein